MYWGLLAVFGRLGGDEGRLYCCGNKTCGGGDFGFGGCYGGYGCFFGGVGCCCGISVFFVSGFTFLPFENMSRLAMFITQTSFNFFI